MINEINYNPNDNIQETEYIELFNPGQTAVDMSNWRIDSAADYLIPSGTVIPVGGYLVIAENPAVIAKWYNITALGPWTGSLSSNGDKVELRDAGGLLVDSRQPIQSIIERHQILRRLGDGGID